MELIFLLLVGVNPAVFSPILLLPLLFVFWVLRTRTEVSATGITTHKCWGATTSIAWDQVKGIGFVKAKAFVETTSGTKVTLPAVSFHDIPRLSAASLGRIPDVLTAGHDAAHAQVTVKSKGDYDVLVPNQPDATA